MNKKYWKPPLPFFTSFLAICSGVIRFRPSRLRFTKAPLLLPCVQPRLGHPEDLQAGFFGRKKNGVFWWVFIGYLAFCWIFIDHPGKNLSRFPWGKLDEPLKHPKHILQLSGSMSSWRYSHKGAEMMDVEAWGS